MRQDQMEQADPAKPAPDKPAQHKTVSIHHDGKQFHVSGGGQDKSHDDIDTALEHARSIFGGAEAGSEDAAMAAGGAGGSL